jgi:hypothetical protein
LGRTALVNDPTVYPFQNKGKIRFGVISLTIEQMIC